MRRILAGLVCAGLLGCHQKGEEAAPPLAVTVAPIVQRDVLVHRTWVGLLNGYQNADIRAQVTGYLLTQDYKEGSVVKPGDVLFTLDARPYQAALEQAQADYAQKIAQAELARITLDRQTQLFKTKVISQQEYDTYYQNSQAATAAAAAAFASVQAAQVNLGYCTIYAPFEGVAGKAQAQIGDLVGPAGTANVLTQISQLDPIKSVFSITEREYLEAAAMLATLEGKPKDELAGRIQIELADGKVWPHLGRFDFVNRQVDVATGSISIEALFPNPQNVLRPGLFVRVTAPVRNLDGALLVPQQATVELQGGHLISVAGADNTVETIPVELGPVDGADIVVKSPKLKAGMQVVVGGAEKVRPGMKVATSPFVAPAPASEAGAAQP